MASISRKSSASPVTVIFFQVAPPSLVRRTVLPEPLAHATRSFTAETPRSRAVTPLVCVVHCGAAMVNRREIRNVNMSKSDAFESQSRYRTEGVGEGDTSENHWRRQNASRGG